MAALNFDEAILRMAQGYTPVIEILLLCRKREIPKQFETKKLEGKIVRLRISEDSKESIVGDLYDMSVLWRDGRVEDFNSIDPEHYSCFEVKEYLGGRDKLPRNSSGSAQFSFNQDLI